jgi:hypothetical protein
VCSGFSKRSCSLKNLKRDGDSAKSHRALGRLLAGLNSQGWLQTGRLNPAGFSFPFAGRGRLTLRFKPMLLVRGGFHRPGKSGGPPLLEPGRDRPAHALDGVLRSRASPKQEAAGWAALLLLARYLAHLGFNHEK